MRNAVKYDQDIEYDHEGLERCSDNIMEELRSFYAYNNKKRMITLKKLLTTLSICDYRNMCMRYSRNRSSKNFSSQLVSLIDKLIVNGYVTNQGGFINRKLGISSQSRLHVTEKLHDLFVKYDVDGCSIFGRIYHDKELVKVKNATGVFQTGSIEKELSGYNHFLAKYDIQAQTIDERYKKFNEPSKLIIKLVRRYNEDLNHGGRFYTLSAGHVGLKKDERSTITINDHETTELDYSTLHLSMLLDMEGHGRNDDDLYTIYPGQSKLTRSIVKKSVNIMLNAENKQHALDAMNSMLKDFALWHELSKIGKTMADIMEDVFDHYSCISHHFCSGVGLVLQCHDSRLAEKILKTCQDNDIPCLPVHDSFIVPEEHESFLLDLMTDVYQDAFAQDIKIKKAC